MKFHKTVLAGALALAALQANAVTTSFAAATEAPSGFMYVAPTFTTGNSTLAYLATDSVPNVRMQPLYDHISYLVVQPTGSATINFTGPSFSFLWGSPDPSNAINIDTGAFTGTGSALMGATANSSNANTQWFTFSGLSSGAHSLTLTTNQIAFEVAVLTPVPEPQTYALMLGGLGALVFVARRRNV